MRHNRIAGNAYRKLCDRYDGTPCQVFVNDIKLHVAATDSVYYPDAFVYCGSAVAAGERLVRDAALIVEVLNDITAGIDRREKLFAYQRLPDLRSYWLVSQDEQRVELHQRDPDGRWTATAYGRGDALPHEAGPLPLADLYAGTDLA